MKVNGVFVAKPGNSIGRGDLGYRSDRPRFQVALKPRPKHIQIFDDFVGGTALPVVDFTSTYETLATIPHGRTYTPETLSYYFIKSHLGDSVSLPAGRYNSDKYLYSGTAPYYDIIYTEADRTNVYIKHATQGFIASPSPSVAPDYILRVKIYILSNDSRRTSYNYFDNV